MVVLRVSFEVLRELLNALRQYGNLHFRRAGIFIMEGYFLDDFHFLGFGNHVLIIAQRFVLCKPLFSLSIEV